MPFSDNEDNMDSPSQSDPDEPEVKIEQPNDAEGKELSQLIAWIT